MWDVHTLQIWGIVGLAWGILGGHTQSSQDPISAFMFLRKFSESKAVFAVGLGMEPLCGTGSLNSFTLGFGDWGSCSCSR